MLPPRPVLMHELYEWFIDLIGMLRCRVSSSILLFQARIICSDILASVQDDINEGRRPAGTIPKLPMLTGEAGMQFIRRWRTFFDVSWRKCNLRFKCAYTTILLRVTMCWETSCEYDYCITILQAAGSVSPSSTATRSQCGSTQPQGVWCTR